MARFQRQQGATAGLAVLAILIVYEEWNSRHSDRSPRALADAGPLRG